MNSAGILAALPVLYNDPIVQYMALWAFVFGAALVWMVMHFRRNAYIRRKVWDCRVLDTRLEDILQHSRDALYSFNLKSGQFDYMSPACFSLTGHVVSELEQAGLSGLLEHVHPEDQGKIFRLIEGLPDPVKEREWNGQLDLRFRHRDGQYRSLSNQVRVSYDASGEALSLSGSVQDISQISHLRDNMRILEREFQDSQKMAGLGLLASGIAHDFNNLMTVVLGNAELALLDCGGSDGGSLDEIKRTTLRAAELATQMLVYTGKATINVDNMDLSSVVQEMGLLLDVSLSKKVKIEYCLADDLPLIRGDVSQIRQVAMNLITNASEAIGDKPGVIAITAHAVQLKPGGLTRVFPPGQVLDGSYVRLEVSDTGAGMNEATLQQIFNPLFTTKVTGRGLGLASLLNAVQRHNGAVEVQSELGKGTVFRVYFPAAEQVPGISKEELLQPDSEWRGYGTVLIADDEAAMREVTTSFMKRLGFQVVVAVDGHETVELFTRHAEEISVVLMDLNMPRLNGLEATSRIRHISPSVPVLFMSGYPRDQVMERFGQHPYTDFIKKPFRSDSLAVAIRHVMERRG